MYIKEFEAEIQRDISPDLTLKRTQPDLCGVHYKDKYIGIPTPAEFVFDCVNMKYTDNPPWYSGQQERVVYRSRPLLKHLISFKYKWILK